MERDGPAGAVKVGVVLECAGEVAVGCCGVGLGAVAPVVATELPTLVALLLGSAVAVGDMMAVTLVGPGAELAPSQADSTASATRSVGHPPPVLRTRNSLRADSRLPIAWHAMATGAPVSLVLKISPFRIEPS